MQRPFSFAHTHWERVRWNPTIAASSWLAVRGGHPAYAVVRVRGRAGLCYTVVAANRGTALDIALLTLAIIGGLVWLLRGKRPPYEESRYGRFPPFEQQSARPVPNRTEVCGAAYIVDGDTLIIQKTQIRLFGIDAPELDHPHGKSAKWALVSLCKGKTVRAEITAQDTHGRTVARCYLEDGRDLSAEMIRLGLAIDWPKFSGGKYSSLEVPGVRKKLWLADARQKGQIHVWEQYEARKSARWNRG